MTATEGGRRLLERGVPLSKSRLWELQRRFYEGEGVRAWANRVPFYITSNPYIADSCAQILVSFLAELSRRRRPAGPACILELGAGSGLFGFYLVRRLAELAADLPPATPGFVYVMTDLAAANVNFWRRHPALAPYVEAGLLDFAVFDLEADAEVRLLVSGRVLRPPATGEAAVAPAPLMVVANYLFDTLPQDAFHIVGSRAREGLVELWGPRGAGAEEPRVEDVEVRFCYRDIALPHYGDEELDALLASYLRGWGDARFLLPVASLRGLRRLRALGGGEMLLLATDKGYAAFHEEDHRGDPHLAVHGGSFSLMLEFDALARSFRRLGGSAWHQSTQQGIVSALYTAGFDLDAFPATRRAAETHLDRVGPGDVFNLYRHIVASREECSLETLVSFLNLTRWDPHIFDLCVDTLVERVLSAPAPTGRDLVAGLEKVAANFYYMPGRVDTLANLGAFHQHIGDCRRALSYYRRSLELFGDTEAVLGNMGICHYISGEPEAAATALRRAVEISPESILARGWLSRVEAAEPPPETVSGRAEVARCGE